MINLGRGCHLRKSATASSPSSPGPPQLTGLTGATGLGLTGLTRLTGLTPGSLGSPIELTGPTGLTGLIQGAFCIAKTMLNAPGAPLVYAKWSLTQFMTFFTMNFACFAYTYLPDLCFTHIF